MEIKNVGVVGCGIMGAGIAQTCSQYKYNVVVSEVNADLLSKGIKSIDSILSSRVAKGKMAQAEKDGILGRIKGTTDMRDFSQCDFVIEAAVEDLNIKKGIFAQLDKTCPPHAILASNTSVLSVTDMAAATNRKDKVLGMHFSNPVPVMRIMEMIKTIGTSEETIATAKSFSESIGKTVVITKDLPGFISNRISTSFLLNGIRLVEAGIATAEDIDTVFKLGAGHPMGPLETLDLIGIDTVLKGATALYDELRDPQYLPPQLMKKMVAMGWLGRKTGKGFYTYPK
ncbi:MAG: 3-hydroxybutyryl-CoA dehydrogenase [Chloroflexi bacterium]|nr:3-hydroxybutyryl-CoA dehydrogenase [Chloroflexota bacterium]